MIFHEIELLIHFPWVMQAALLAGALLVLAGLSVRRRIAEPEGGVIPDEGVTIRNLIEIIVEWLSGMARERMGTSVPGILSSCLRRIYRPPAPHANNASARERYLQFLPSLPRGVRRTRPYVARGSSGRRRPAS